MIICITSTGESLDHQVDPRFGRCRYFIIYNTESDNFEAIPNSNASAGGGAGVQSGQLMAEKNVEAVVTGNVGPNAFQTLHAGGIEIYTGAGGTVKEAIENYKNGRLSKAESHNVGSKFGLNS
ncbi:MAG: NifB/NifX family molybdenum-iron cluster-binding protein [Spirochaetota bacterium]